MRFTTLFIFAVGLCLVSGCINVTIKDNRQPRAGSKNRTITGLIEHSGKPNLTRLREHIAGSGWHWDGPQSGEKVVFGSNGYVKHEGWDARGLVTRWEVIDHHTVLLEIER